MKEFVFPLIPASSKNNNSETWIILKCKQPLYF